MFRSCSLGQIKDKRISQVKLMFLYYIAMDLNMFSRLCFKGLLVGLCMLGKLKATSTCVYLLYNYANTMYSNTSKQRSLICIFHLARVPRLCVLKKEYFTVLTKQGPIERKCATSVFCLTNYGSSVLFIIIC